ncbi:MoaD/ThiS family protein [Rhodococcus erythropolis]|nr:MoaD/ThiS family protein [Rhodococcus erythropolis]
MYKPSTTPLTDLIRVRFFAAAKAEYGAEETTLSIPSECTVDDALALAGLEDSAVIRRSSFLVNGIASERSSELRNGDELDVLPPFAGG